MVPMRILTPPRGGGAATLWAWLRTWLARPEAVDLIERRFNFLPRVFRWRGGLWRVRLVLDVWERGPAHRQAARRYFRVVCQDGQHCILFQDLCIGTWYVSLGGV